ncbi:hypothetical protein ACFQDG_09490 [Natronoarchaeum mannanilyticum]
MNGNVSGASAAERSDPPLAAPSAQSPGTQMDPTVTTASGTPDWGGT